MVRIAKEEKTISVKDAANQLRLFIYKHKTHTDYYELGSYPTFKSIMRAGEWIRNHGHDRMTNNSFMGLLANIVCRTVTEEESTVVRVLAGPAAALMTDKHCFMFITQEELEEIKHQINNKIEPLSDLSINETVLGFYAEINHH